MHKKLSGGQVLGPMQNRFVYVHRMATILNAGQATCYVIKLNFQNNKLWKNNKMLFLDLHILFAVLDLTIFTLYDPCCTENPDPNRIRIH
jgi:hypothetical protein